MTFYIAMQNRRAMASYLHPQTIVSEQSEYLIVSRSGGRNEFLSISNAGACTGHEDTAPARLHPDLVLCATLVSQGPRNGEIFIVERDPPEGLQLQGRFVGGDGYFLLEQAAGHLALTGSVRLKPGARTQAAAPGCILLGASEPGAAVHFHASYVPWTNELLPAGFASGPPDLPGPLA